MDGKANFGYYDEDKSYWKYLVLLASFCIHIIMYGLAWGAGVFQVIFMEEFPGKSGVVSMIPTALAACIALIGPVASALVNRFNCRTVVGLSGILSALGLVLSSFANSKGVLFATFTMIGIGLGLAGIPMIVIVCYYFEKKRPIATALAASGLGMGTLLMPPFIRILVNQYGWRGSLLILGAVAFNLVVAAAIFRPIKLPEIVHPVNKSRKVLRVKMLREIPFLCLFFNNVLVLYGMVSFYIHLPAYGKLIGYSDDESAVFVSIAGGATVAARIASGFIVQKLNAPISIYALSLGFGGLCVMITPSVTSTGALATLCALYGLGSGVLGPMLPLIISDLVGIQALSDGYGYILVAEGIGALLGPPISGFMYDATSNYTASLCVAGASMVIGSSLMIIPLLHVRKRHLAELLLTNINQETPMTIMQRKNQSTCSEKPLLLSVTSEASNFGDLSPNSDLNFFSYHSRSPSAAPVEDDNVFVMGNSEEKQQQARFRV